MNELSVASFYYNCFLDGKGENSTEKATKNESKDLEEVGAKEVWVEDTWTDHDEKQAEELLQSHAEKCKVHDLDRREREDDGEVWNQFYRDHGDRFFKDRHYLVKAFPEEFAFPEDSTEEKTLVEIGCGVGNALLPLLEDKHRHWSVIHGLDISAEAIKLLRKDSRFVHCNEGGGNRKVYGHVADLAEAIPESCVGVADVATLLFCFSAIDPACMEKAARHVASILKPGGVLAFRDYGRYDEAQMKLGTSRSKMLTEHFYRKHDGTKCFYFTIEGLEELFQKAGLEVLELKYLRRVYRNNALRETRRRIWVQGRFRKPLNAR